MSVETIWRERSSLKLASVMIDSLPSPLGIYIYIFITYPPNRRMHFLYVHGAHIKTEQCRPQNTQLKLNKCSHKSTFKTGNELKLGNRKISKNWKQNHTILNNSWMDQRVSQEKNENTCSWTKMKVEHIQMYGAQLTSCQREICNAERVFNKGRKASSQDSEDRLDLEKKMKPQPEGERRRWK